MFRFKLILLVTSFILPLALSATILGQTGKTLAKKVMIFGLFNAGLVFLFNYFYFEKIFSVYSYIHSLHIATVLWLFPSIYLYVRAFILDKNLFLRDFRHLLPGVSFGLISGFLFYGLLGNSERIYYLTNYRSGIDLVDPRLKAIYIFRIIDVAVIATQVLYYSFVLMKLPRCYKEILLEEFSNIERFSISWIKWFNFSFAFIGILCIVFYIFNPYSEQNELFLISFFFLISIFIWLIGIVSLRQQRPNISIPTLDCTQKETDSSNIQDDTLSQKLIEYMEIRKAFLQCDLTLTMVCKELGTNRTYLSTLINHKFGLNFNTFINQYRIKYISNYSAQNPKTPKETLAEIGGFGSVSSMRRAMKRDYNVRL